MTRDAPASIHGSAVLIGDRAVLIRGPSGSGKSRLAFDLLLAAMAGQIAPARLVGDDRLYLEASGNGVIARPAPELAGLIEIRGLGIRRCAYVAQAPVGLVVDLDAADASRLPLGEALETLLCGVRLPRIPVGAGFMPLPMVLGAVVTEPYCPDKFTVPGRLPEANC